MMSDHPIQPGKGAAVEDNTPRPDGGLSMLAEVGFKWLMAGQGWWIDTGRFHQDPSYAAGFFVLAQASPSLVLRECAAMVEAQILGLSKAAPQA